MADLPPTIEEAATALRAGTLSSQELTVAALERIDRHDAWVHSLLTRFDSSASERARKADEELAAGTDLGRLHGIPIGVKDILAAREGPTTAQSVVLDPAWGAGHDATVVRRLRDNGAVIVGKTTTMEFAAGLPEETETISSAGQSVAPWLLAGRIELGHRQRRGLRLLLAGLGSDTGGSIRLPAAFCGVSGLMPTYGRVPKSGCVPLGFSLDHVGPLARSAWDCAAVLAAIAGHDPLDPDCSERSVPDYFADIDRGIAGLRVGVAREHHLKDTRPDLVLALESAVATLAELGAEISEVTLPLYPEIVAATMVTIGAEACAYHHRDLATRWKDYTAAARRVFAVGALVSGSEYVQAQRVRKLAQRKLAELLSRVDVVVMLTSSLTAPPLDEVPRLDLGNSVYTAYWDAVGNPVLAIPIGFVDGMPIGMQLAAAPFAEDVLLRAGVLTSSTPGGISMFLIWRPIVDDQRTVRALLDSAGFHPPEEDMEALLKAYSQMRRMAELLFAVEESRYESPALSFQPDPGRA